MLASPAKQKGRTMNFVNRRTQGQRKNRQAQTAFAAARHLAANPAVTEALSHAARGIASQAARHLARHLAARVGVSTLAASSGLIIGGVAPLLIGAGIVLAGKTLYRRLTD